MQPVKPDTATERAGAHVGTRRAHILGLVDDLVSSLLYYDRKEDEDCPCGQIEEALASDEISQEDMVIRFRAALHNAGREGLI